MSWLYRPLLAHRVLIATIPNLVGLRRPVPESGADRVFAMSGTEHKIGNLLDLFYTGPITAPSPAFYR